MEHPIYSSPQDITNQEKNNQIFELLGSIASDQKIIMEQNEAILRNERNKKIWGVVKWVVLIGFFFLSIWSIPAMIQSMVGNIGTGGIEQLLQGL
ncbi:hypothetical protein K9L27_02300 [Candidatus Gracilibacteria bacterium]|nr:hypothetical protein [Candidatus Gracilibacteria bacterium]